MLRPCKIKTFPWKMVPLIYSLFSIYQQTHPNIDKKLFAANGTIALKNPSKPFPLGQDVGVLKWRFQTQDDAYIPLSSKYPCELKKPRHRMTCANHSLLPMYIFLGCASGNEHGPGAMETTCITHNHTLTVICIPFTQYRTQMKFKDGFRHDDYKLIYSTTLSMLLLT